ncbi:hypothetical protein [uncultured Duncaniella sp.]|uniref:hypothetical protein n=1 Tax=uncultured Duncaniella sp. TaxID=2768039 RepID=UPI0026373CE5|nr:hypothetical protein [uncultured Duncaniella sp.]
MLSSLLGFDKEEGEEPALFSQFYPTKGGEIALLDVRAELAKALKGVEVNKGTSYQSEVSRRHPDRVITIQRQEPKWVRHYGRDGSYRYQL